MFLEPLQFTGPEGRQLAAERELSQVQRAGEPRQVAPFPKCQCPRLWCGYGPPRLATESEFDGQRKALKNVNCCIVKHSIVSSHGSCPGTQLSGWGRETLQARKKVQKIPGTTGSPAGLRAMTANTARQGGGRGVSLWGTRLLSRPGDTVDLQPHGNSGN